MKKKFIIFIMIIAGALALYSEGNEVPGFYLDSINLEIPGKYPLIHYREFSEYEVGFGMQFNYRVGGSGFRMLLGADATYNFNSTARIDHLVDANATLGFGWEFNPGKGGVTITPQVSGGIVFHILNGDFMLDGNKETNVYFDQLYRFQLEMAYTFNTDEKKKTHIGFFISPSFEVFSGEKYWGYIPGGTVGIRLQFDPTM